MAECNFEKDLDRLEKIVASLEEGGLSLDDSLKQFEQGIKLARRCERALSEAEKKIEVLTRRAGGEMEAEPFEDEPAPLQSDGKADGRVKGPKPAVGEENPVEAVAEKRRVPRNPENGADDEEEEDEGTMLF